MNKWIDTKDDLPTVGYLTVLLWLSDGCSVGYYDLKQNQWFDVFDNELNNVLFWQPLPFGPKGESAISWNMIRAKAS